MTIKSKWKSAAKGMQGHWICITDEGQMPLARAIWIIAYGPIPEGLVLHHRDEDVDNNCLNNFELMTNAAHIRHHHTGKHQTEETKRKIGEANAGRSHTEECKQKISETTKRDWDMWHSRTQSKETIERKKHPYRERTPEEKEKLRKHLSSLRAGVKRGPYKPRQSA